VEKKPEPKLEPTGASDDTKPAKPPAPAPGSVSDEQMKLRVDFYQTSQNVTVSLFVKDAKKEDLGVKFSKNQVSSRFAL
jgi:suppressor of G2 allele of SKP1